MILIRILGAVWVGIGAVSIDVFVKILVSMQGRKENLSPKKRKQKNCNFFNWDCNRDECNSNTDNGYRYDPCDPNPPCPPCVPTKNGYYKCPPCPKSNCFTLPECEKDRYQPTGKY